MMKHLVKGSLFGRAIASRAICALAFAALSITNSSLAGTLTVSNLNDGGAGSLRQAISDAIAGDTITFSVSGTITLTRGALNISQDVTIQGPGPNKVKISGNNASRVFMIQAGTVALRHSREMTLPCSRNLTPAARLRRG
jgi:hypothetical protein